MTRALGWLLSGLVLVLAVGQSLHADTARNASAKPRTLVVLVGISNYADNQIKPRPHAEADVLALHQLLSNKAHLDANPADIKLLLGKPTGKAEAATRDNFLKAIRWAVEQAQPQDTLLLGFIGQGGPLGTSGDLRCYFLADSTFKQREKTAVAAEEIEEAFKKFKGRLAVFLDIDFTGFTEEGASTAVAEPTLGKAPYREFLGDDGTEDHAPIAGRVAFLATNGLNTSLDLDKHGLFATVLLEALAGKADTDGYEADGLVTVDELAKYLNKRLPELARQHGKTEKQREQEHFILSGPRTHFVLTRNPPAWAESVKRLEKFEQLVQANTIQSPFVEEGRALLERMPTLKKKQELRKAYQQLVDGKSDLATFTNVRENILESMKLREADAAQFARKVLEAIEIIKEDYVREVNEGQMVGWAIRELYNYLEEPIPPQTEARLKNVDTISAIQPLRKLLIEARKDLGKREDLDNLKDLTIALQRMLNKLDPHTTYIDPEARKQFEKEIAGNFTGIGIQIRKDVASDRLLIITPIKGSPAQKAGLQAGDIITTIIREVDSDGNPLSPTEVTDTKGLALNKAVKMILGQPNTKVKLRVQREGQDKPLEFEIQRGNIEIESVLGYRRKRDGKGEWDFMIDPKNKIGYVRLSSFARNTFRDMDSAIKELRKQGLKGLVLDLRFNPGGLLDIAIKVTDLFIDDGLVVSVRPRGGSLRETRFNGRHEGSLLDFPIVCLINGYSASGSEIVSAALQDHARALIIGERSYGKGSVQNIRDFEVMDPRTGEIEKAEIKLTTASFWRPNGKNLNKASTSGKEEEEWGVIPDKVIKLTARERRDLAEYQRNVEIIEPIGKPSKLKEIKDRQLEAALEYLRGQIKLAGRASTR